mmetsp:Transcript_22970/g.59071  ORF Transcript_22970/g.59071 Transcript_22970/m.59071 type:complete len:342 (+) Transcript_22970:14-1039(+)
MPAVLVAPGSSAHAEAELRARWGLGADAIVVRDSASHVTDASADHVVALCCARRTSLLKEVTRVLKHGGTVTLHELQPGPGAGSSVGVVDADTVLKAAAYAGLTGAAIGEPVAPTEAAFSDLVKAAYPALASMSAQIGEGHEEAADALRALAHVLSAAPPVRATKPAYATGASVSLRSRKLLAAAEPQADATEAWAQAAAAAGAGNGAELMDEDELLDAPDAALPERAGADKCTPQTRKQACANCSCGLKEMQEAAANSEPPPKSSCGSCGLGDAFRCEGCPYRGMPPFKPGEEVKITESMLKGEASGPTAGEGAAPVTSSNGAGAGVVKLNAAMMMEDDI